MTLSSSSAVPRDYVEEAYEELLDALHDVSVAVAELRPRKAMRARVYVCHPFASDPKGNTNKVRILAKTLIEAGVLPIAPHLYLPQLLDEATDRETALSLCLDLLATCDELCVFGDLLTEDMQRELREAKRLGIPVHFVRQEVHP
jgi:SRSO17 transposase